MTIVADPVRETAVRLLVEVEAGASLEPLLDAADCTDPRDRRFLRQLVAGVVKWRDRLDWIANAFARRPVASLAPGVRQVLRLGVYQLLWLDRVPGRAAVHSSVELAKKLEHAGTGGFVNAVLRRTLSAGRQVAYPDRDTDAEGYFAVYYSHPRWLVSRWLDRWGATRTEDLLRANNEAAVVYLRRGAGSGTPALPERFGAEAVDDDADAVRLLHPEGVFDDPAFAAGWYAQDVNAGLAARLLAVEPGDRVLDVCAAPGGKALQLSAAGRVTATDISRDRLQRVGDHARRLGRTLHLVVEDGETPAARGPFDRVLADVPCSGTGVLGRHPEARWRKHAADLPRQAERQLRILTAAFARLRPGGVLVYSTCSLEEEENDGVVDRFLAAHADAVVEPAARHFPDRPWAARTVQTLPGREPGDGAYAARIRRLAPGAPGAA